MQTIDIGYRPREQFIPFHKRKERWSIAVAHRRAGKTVACVADLVDAALRSKMKDARFAYIAPYYAQAKDVAWTYLKRFSAGIPEATINESELRVDYPNGARIRLYGADNYERLRGIYLDGVVLDEYADFDPAAWPEVIRPTLSDRNGWAVFIGTPKGRNAFFDLWDNAAESGWYRLMLKASETGILTADELSDVQTTMSEDQFQQEYECSFEAAIQGAYYAKLLQQAENDGRICKLSADPLLTKRAAWDLGVADHMTIWIAQWVGQEIRFLDYIEAKNQPLSYYVNEMRRRGHEDALCLLPHDGVERDKFTAIRFEDHLRDAGFQVKTIPNQGKGAAMKRVEMARRLFPKMWFNDKPTSVGRWRLSAYHEKIDKKTGVGLGPEHDDASHGSDSFGLMAIAYEEPASTRSFNKTIQYSNAGVY